MFGWRPQIFVATESNLGNEASWIAHSINDMKGVAVICDEMGRVGVRTKDKVNMASRLQYLLADGERLCLSSPFCVGDVDMHADAQRTPTSRVLHMLSKQLLAVRRVTTERTGTAVRTTVTGKGEQGRWNDDLAMSIIIGTHCMMKWKRGVYERPTKVKFAP